VMLADSSRCEEGDYLFKFEDEKLLMYGKDLRGADISGEYVGIAMIRREFQNIFLGKLQSLIDAQQHSLWWEDVLYSLIAEERDVYVKDITGLFWSEIDFIEDYRRITEYRHESGASRASRVGP
jgi:choline kinase